MIGIRNRDNEYETKDLNKRMRTTTALQLYKVRIEGEGEHVQHICLPLYQVLQGRRGRAFKGGEGARCEGRCQPTDSVTLVVWSERGEGGECSRAS